jgi:hypothetical protein
MIFFNRGGRTPTIQNLKQEQVSAQKPNFIKGEQEEARPVLRPDFSFENLTDTMKILFRRLYSEIIPHDVLGEGSSSKDNGKAGQNYVKVLDFIKQNSTRLCDENARVTNINPSSEGANLDAKSLASLTLHYLLDIDWENNQNKHTALNTVNSFLLPSKEVKGVDPEGYSVLMNRAVYYEPINQDNYEPFSKYDVRAYRLNMQQMQPALKENYMELYEDISSLLHQGGHQGNLIAEVMKLNRSNEDIIVSNIKSQRQIEFPIPIKDAVIYDVSLNILREIAMKRGDPIQGYLEDAQNIKINSMTTREWVEDQESRNLGSVAPTDLDSGLNDNQLKIKQSRNHESRAVFDENVRPMLIKEGLASPILDLYKSLLDTRHFDFKDIYSGMKIQDITSPQEKEDYILQKIAYIDSKMNTYAEALGVESGFAFKNMVQDLVREGSYRISAPVHMAKKAVVKISTNNPTSSINFSNISGRKDTSVNQSPVAEMSLEEVKFWKSELSTKKIINSGNSPMLTAVQTLENVIQSRVDSISANNSAPLLTINQAYYQLTGDDLNTKPEAKMTIDTLAEEIKTDYNRMFSFLGLNSGFQIETSSSENSKISLEQRRIV